MALQKVKKSVPMKVNKKPQVVQATHGKPAGECVVAIGRRKTATARIRMYRGKNQSMVNDKPLNEYFLSVDPMHTNALKPFVVTNTSGEFYITAKVSGSGLKAQEDAIVHGVARALVKVSETHKAALRKAGLLSRDPRMKESRKMGTGGKARRAKQSPKR